MPRANEPVGRPEAPAGSPFHALVPAGGRGERFGIDRPKQFVPVHGIPLVAHAVARLLDAGCVSVVVALPDGSSDALRARFAGDPRVRLVSGGASRQASVAAALEASPAGAGELVAIHDGARPAPARSDLVAVVAAALAHDGAVLGRAVSDTLKEVREGRILATVDRRDLFRAETPQVFRRELLERAFAMASRDRFVGTDDAALVERLGGVDIVAVEARHPNPKLTRPHELAEIERLLASSEGGADDA